MWLYIWLFIFWTNCKRIGDELKTGYRFTLQCNKQFIYFALISPIIKAIFNAWIRRLLLGSRRRIRTNRGAFRNATDEKKREPNFDPSHSSRMMMERVRWVNFLNGQTDDDVYVRVAGSRFAEAWIKDGNRFVGNYYRHSRNDVPLICSRGIPKALAAIIRTQAS